MASAASNEDERDRAEAGEASEDPSIRRQNGKYRRARIRHRIVAVAAETIARGQLTRRHVNQPIVVRRLECSLPDWPLAFDGLRIAHYSDLHLGSLLPMERALGAIELVRAEAADLVAFTGDLVDLDIDGVEPLVEAMGSVTAPLGHFFVLGNHDHLDDPRGVVRLARSAGLSVLLDEAAAVGGSAPLGIAGIDWGRGVRECRIRVDSVCNRTDGPIHLLLSHNPLAFPEASRRGIPLTLAGHTHGGQVARKANPAHNLAIGHRFRAGFYAKGPSALFVTKGLGAWFPLRLHCDPEVVALTVRRGPFALPTA
jgi:predicted MPP superfamily phosphohydrolase